MMTKIIARQKLLVLLVLMPIIFAQFSCGLINDQQMPEKIYGMDKLQEVCKIDTNRFKKILTEDIHPQINCLERNLDQFARFVKRKDQSVIERGELKKFINKFMKLDTEHTESLLYVVFQVNSIILKDKPDTIQVSNLKAFISLVHIFNKEGRKFKDLLDDIKADGYLGHRNKMLTLLDGQSKLIKSVVNGRTNNKFKLNTMKFLTKIKNSFKLPHKQLDLKLIKSLLFVKKLFIGGNEKELSGKDMDIIIERLPQLAKVFFDALNVTPEYFKADSDYYKFQVKNLNDFENIVLKLNLNEVLINHPDLMKVLAQIIPTFDWKQMSKSLLIAKKDFIKGDSNEYTFANFQSFLILYRESLEIRYFNSLTFELLRDELNSPLQIQSLLFPGPQHYHLLAKNKLKKLWINFKHIALNHRVFSNDELLIKYTYNYKRTANGVNLLAIEKWMAKKIYKIYAQGKTIDFEEGLTKEQARVFVYNYEEILKEFGILNNGAERLIKELLMGADLFQQSSNGDKKIQIDEIAQVVPMVISANKFGTKIYDKMSSYCDPLKIQDGFELDCYRKNFFPILFYDLNFVNFFPNSFNYFIKSNHTTIIQLLKDAEGQAKIDQTPSSPMTKTDMKRMMANVSNSESLFLKYDVDQNGIFSRLELNKVYKLFEQTLSGISKLKPGSKMLKSLFSYIVLKKKLPTKVALVKFHLLGR